MVTTNDSTIGGASPDYASITLWEAATDNNMVTADTIERGLCRAATFAENVTIAGATTDATRYRVLTIDTASGCDTAFKAGEGNGAVIDPTASGHIFTAQEDYFVWDGLEMTGVVSSSNEAIRINADNLTLTVRNCMIHSLTPSDSDGIYADHNIDGLVLNVENSVFYDIHRCGIHAQMWSGATATHTYNFRNCTMYCRNGADPDNNDVGIRLANTAAESMTVNFENCLIDSFDSTGSGIGAAASLTIVSDDTWFGNDPSADISNIDSNTETNVTDSATFTTSTASAALIFTSLTTGSEDFHLTDHANNDAIDGGSVLSEFTDDADGDTRPGTGSWDAGADEIVGSGDLTVTMTTASLTLAPQSMTVTKSRIVAMTSASLTLTPQAMTVAKGLTVSMTSASLTLAPQAMTVSQSRLVAMTAASLTLAPQPMTIGKGLTVAMGTASLTLAPQAMTVTKGRDIAMTTATLTLAPQAVTVTQSRVVTMTAASLTLSPQSMTVTRGLNVPMTAASLSLSTAAMTIGKGLTVPMTAASLSLTTYAMTVTLGGDRTVAMTTATLALTTHAMTVTKIITDLTVPMTAASLTLAPQSMTISKPRYKRRFMVDIDMDDPSQNQIFNLFATVFGGDHNTNGSWRITPSGNDLVIQRRESGSWVTKSTISA